MAFPDLSDLTAKQWAVLVAGAGLATWGAVDIYQQRRKRIDREQVRRIAAQIDSDRPAPRRALYAPVRTLEQWSPKTVREQTPEERCLNKYKKQGMTEREAFFACYQERHQGGGGYVFGASPPGKGPYPYASKKKKSTKLRKPRAPSEYHRRVQEAAEGYSFVISYCRAIGPEFTNCSLLSGHGGMHEFSKPKKSRNAMNNAAKKRKSKIKSRSKKSVLDRILAGAYHAASTPRRRGRPAKRKLWIDRKVKRPGTFRRMLERAGIIERRERIPLWVKKMGCKTPVEAYRKIFRKTPTRKSARLFQRRACLARTFEDLPTSSGRHIIRIRKIGGRKVRVSLRGPGARKAARRSTRKSTTKKRAR